MSSQRVDVVDLFLRMSGSADGGGGDCKKPERLLQYSTYAEVAVTGYLLASTFAEMLDPGHDMTVKRFAFILLLIEICILLCLGFRLQHRNRFRRMHRYAREVCIPEVNRSRISSIVRYHLIGSAVVVTVPAVYTAVTGSEVRAGDHFTFPYLDVLPAAERYRGNRLVYACKYAFYTVPVFIAHLELCFINTTFVYYVGVLDSNFLEIVRMIDEALAGGGDERKLKDAIAHHQRMLRYFGTMKRVFAPPIIMTIVFSGVYLGMSTYFMIQAIQGDINHIILILCVASSIAALVSMLVYSFYGSEVSVFHDRVLCVLFDHPLFHVSKTFKRFSLIMMARASLPLQVTVCYIVTVNLNLLLKILKTSYSILNVLLSMSVK